MGLSQFNLYKVYGQNPYNQDNWENAGPVSLISI